MNFENFQNHQDAVRRKNEQSENFDRRSLSDEIEKLAIDFDEDTVRMLVGDDEWEINEFDAKLQVWANDALHPEEDLNEVLAVLKEIKAAEIENGVDKEKKIRNLKERLERTY